MPYRASFCICRVIYFFLEWFEQLFLCFTQFGGSSQLFTFCRTWHSSFKHQASSERPLRIMEVKRHCQWFVKNLLSLFNKMKITKSFECCCLYRCSCIIFLFFFSFHSYFLCVTLLLFRFSNGGRAGKVYFRLCEISNVAKVEISWFRKVHRFLDHWSSRWVGVRSSHIHFQPQRASAGRLPGGGLDVWPTILFRKLKLSFYGNGQKTPLFGIKWPLTYVEYLVSFPAPP